MNEITVTGLAVLISTFCLGVTEWQIRTGVTGWNIELNYAYLNLLKWKKNIVRLLGNISKKNRSDKEKLV